MAIVILRPRHLLFQESIVLHRGLVGLKRFGLGFRVYNTWPTFLPREVALHPMFNSLLYAILIVFVKLEADLGVTPEYSNHWSTSTN